VLIDLLRAGAAASPDRALVVSMGGPSTYAAVLERAEALAGELAARGVSRFACRVDDVAELLAVLCAASAVGAEPCVYSAALDAAGIDELADAFGHELLVTDAPRGAGVPELLVADLTGAAGAGAPPAPDRAPVLILTTGTTGRPKGARHDWSRLAAGVRRREGSEAERWLLAYNPNQFAGLQVLLHALVRGSTIVVPSSNQPREALAAMRDHGVTHASATPTFWRFVLALLDDGGDGAADLPLTQITLGGEAVPGPLLDRLRARFPGAHVSQIYASTEFGSSVSVRDGRNGLPLSVLERGDDAGVQFRIVDGELHARSQVGMLGYAGEGDDDGWRPTGDLVEVRGDRIHFVGRTSEVVNVGGVKVHPVAVEEVIAAVEGVAVAVVYGRPNALTGQILAADVVPAPGVDHDELEDRIRAACEHLPRAAVPRRIRMVESLELRGNKLVRPSEGGGS
jgi:acyl-CoA synthetase (AMP-forming)/AMP-acid ligase II